MALVVFDMGIDGTGCGVIKADIDFGAQRRLVGLVGYRLLAQHEAVGGGEGRDEVDGGGPRGTVVAAARGLAVDDDEVRAIGPGLAHPGGEGGREQGGIDPVHQDGEPAAAGDTMPVGQMAAQEVQVGLAPGGDVVVVVAVGHGAADYQQQDFGKRMGDTTNVAWIVDGGAVLKENAEAGLFRELALERRHAGGSESRTPPSNQPKRKLSFAVT